MIIFLPPSRGGRRRGGRRRHDDCCCDDDIIDAMRFKPSQWTVVVVVERDTKSTLEMVYYSYSFFLGVAGPSLQDISHFFKYHHGTTIRTPPPHHHHHFFSLFRVLKKQRKKTEKKTKKKGGKVGREHQTKKQNRWGLFLRLRWKRRRI